MKPDLEFFALDVLMVMPAVNKLLHDHLLTSHMLQMLANSEMDCRLLFMDLVTLISASLYPFYWHAFHVCSSCRVQAYAGCAKTSTLNFIAKAHPDLLFLYTCYNKEVQREASRIFPRNVDCR